MRLTRLAAACLAASVVASSLVAGPATAHHDADWQKLMDPAGLAAVAEHGDVTLIDIRPAEDYAAGHVPGALSAPYAAWRGPKENPGALITDAALTDLLRGLGLTPDSAVVITYQGKDPTDFGAAARVYWTLKSAGLTRLAILNGGISAWNAAGLPLSTEAVVAAPSAHDFTLADTWLADRAAVEAAVAGSTDVVLVDARPEAFFTGEKAHDAAAAAGTLPGAVNLSHAEWFAGEAPTLRPERPVLERLAALGANPGPAAGRRIVSFCNTGHWAATNWFMLSEIAGLPDVRLYPESMVGWTRGGGAAVPGGT